MLWLLVLAIVWHLVYTDMCDFSVGQTQVKQEDVLKLFKDGKHRVIIATSVAEEGLDVKQCNWIIRYEHVTNAVARVQSRGKFFVMLYFPSFHISLHHCCCQYRSEVSIFHNRQAWQSNSSLFGHQSIIQLTSLKCDCNLHAL